MADRVEFIITASGEGAAAAAVQRVGEAVRKAGADAQQASQASAAGAQSAVRAYGDMEVSIARVVSGLALKALALVGVAGAAGGVAAAFKKGIDLVDEFNLTTIGVAATITDLSKDQSNMQMNYARAMAYSKDIYNELELAAARYFASGKEMVQAWNIMAQKGVILRKEEIDHLGVIVDRIKLSTQGQVGSLQIAQELRAVLTGQARQTDQVAMLLRDRLGPEWEKVVEKVRETGSLAPLAEQFKGLALASRDIEQTLEAQKSTLDTMLSQIGRGGLAGAYADITELTKNINEYLTEHRDELVGKIAESWATIKWSIEGAVIAAKMLQEKTALPALAQKPDTGYLEVAQYNLSKAMGTSLNVIFTEPYKQFSNFLSGMDSGLRTWAEAGDIVVKEKVLPGFTAVHDKIKQIDGLLAQNKSWLIDWDTPNRELEDIKSKISYVIEIISNPVSWVINAVITGLPSWMMGGAPAPAPPPLKYTIPDTGLAATQERARLKAQGTTRIQLPSFGLTDIPNWAFPFHEEGAPETVKPKGEKETGKGAEAAANRLISVIDGLNRDIARLSEGAISEVDANLQKTLNDIAKLGEKGVETTDAIALAHKRSSLQKEKIEEDFWLYVAKESGNAFAELDAQYWKDLKAKGNTEEKKLAILEIYQKRTFETQQKYEKEIEDLRKGNLQVLAQATPYLSEQLVIERQVLEIEINRNKAEQEIKLSKMMVWDADKGYYRFLEEAEKSAMRAERERADEARRFAQQRKDWAAGGLPGWAQGWAFERITEMEKRGYEEFKNYMGRAESWLGQTFGQSAWESLQGKQADFRKLFSDAMGGAFQDLYKISARTVFDMGARFLSPDTTRQGGAGQGANAGAPLLLAAQGLKQAGGTFNLNAAQFGLAAGGLLLSGVGIATNSQALVVAGTVLQMAGLGIQLYQTLTATTQMTAAAALTIAAGELSVAAWMLMASGAMPFFHQGGVITAHTGWPRLHSDEVPIIAQTGEGILPRGAMRRLGPRRFESLRSGNFETESGGSNFSSPTSLPGGNTIIIQAWDSEDVGRFLKRHGNAVYDSQRQPIRNSRPLSTFKNINGGRR